MRRLFDQWLIVVYVSRIHHILHLSVDEQLHLSLSVGLFVHMYCIGGCGINKYDHKLL